LPICHQPKNSLLITQHEKLKQQCQQCFACSLAQTRKNIVFNRGNVEYASILHCAEAPGAKEDKEGLPLIGRSGQFYQKAIDKLGLTERSYFCNTIKCRPPNNRDPTKDEKEACLNYLVQQVSLIQPKLVVAIGTHASKTFLGKNFTMRNHGVLYSIDSWHGIALTVLPVYHPAFIMRMLNTTNATKYRAEYWTDLQQMTNF